MFKTINATLILGLIIILSSCMGNSKEQASPESVVTYKDDKLEMELTYCQPHKKGRLIFGTEEEGALVPYGKKWRTGANAATQITINSGVIFGGQELPAGTYTIYTIPGPDQWTVAVNSRTDYWGMGWFGSPFKEKKDVIRVEAPTMQQDASIDQFTINFIKTANGAEMEMLWDMTRVAVPITKI